MLMTKYTYTVEIKDGGVQTTVTRLADSATKSFFNAGHYRVEDMSKFMDSITDDLADGYFPREKNKK